jgi:hypothetical protein
MSQNNRLFQFWLIKVWIIYFTKFHYDNYDSDYDYNYDYDYDSEYDYENISAVS